MRTKYKKYSIHYNGRFMEHVQATSKKNVKDYIKDNYVTYITKKDGILRSVFYVFSKFEINQVAPLETK